MRSLSIPLLCALIVPFFSFRAHAVGPIGTLSEPYHLTRTVGRVTLSDAAPESAPIDLTFTHVISNRLQPIQMYPEFVVVALSDIQVTPECQPTVKILTSFGSGATDFGSVGNISATYGGRFRNNGGRLKLRLTRSCGQTLSYAIKGIRHNQVSTTIYDRI